METRHVSVLQGTTAAPVQEPAEDYRLNGSALWTPDPAGGRNVRSGIVPAPAASDGNGPLAVIATPSTAGSVTIKAGHFVVQGKTALSGSYVGTVDVDKVRTISPLPTSGGYKAGRVVLHVYDQGYSDAQDGWDIEVLLGAQAASSAAAVLPVIPAVGTYFEVREFTVDSAGNVSFTGPLPPYTVPRGGIPPVSSTDTVAGAYMGQYRDHPTWGLQRWSSSLWKKMPGVPTEIASSESLGGAGAIAPSGSGFGLTNEFSIPAHQPGTLRLRISMVLVPSALNTTVAGYAQLFIGPATTGQSGIGSRTRFHNNGAANVSVVLEALYDSDGASKYLVALGWNDAGSGSNVSATVASAEAWLL